MPLSYSTQPSSPAPAPTATELSPIVIPSASFPPSLPSILPTRRRPIKTSPCRSCRRKSTLTSRRRARRAPSPLHLLPLPRGPPCPAQLCPAAPLGSVAGPVFRSIVGCWDVHSPLPPAVLTRRPAAATRATATAAPGAGRPGHVHRNHSGEVVQMNSAAFAEVLRLIGRRETSLDRTWLVDRERLCAVSQRSLCSLLKRS